VALSSRPSADVTVTVAGSAQVSAPTSVTFTPATWNEPRTVIVGAVDDDVDEASPHTGTLTFAIVSTAMGYSSEAVVRIDGTVTPTALVAIADDDAAGITVSGALTLDESGDEGTLSLVLESEPLAPVTIPISTTGLCIAGPPSVTFTAADWDEPQAVTVRPGEDDIDHDQTCTVVTGAATSSDGTYAGLAVADTTTPVADDDTAGVSITADDLVVHEHTGAAAAYTVVLDTEPTAAVAVEIGTGDGQVVPVASTLTFTPEDWDEPQTVTLSAVDDDTPEPSPHSGTVTHRAASGDPAYDADVPFTVNGTAGTSLSAAVTDDETAVALDVSPEPASDAATTTVRAYVTGGEPSVAGTITFTLDGTPLAPSSIVDGTTAAVLGTLAPGDHTLDAVFSGDDRHDGSSTSITVHVLARPAAADDTVTVEEDGRPVVIDVLANDADADGDAVEVVAGSWSQGEHGAVECTNDGCEYTPDADFNGSDTFTYAITDGRFSDVATVVVTVTPVNDAPVVGDVEVTATGGSSTTFDVLAGTTDVDGDGLTVAGHSTPGHGTVTCSAAGECTYAPDSGFAGIDSFTFTVSDGEAAAADAQAGRVTITATAAPASASHGGSPAGAGSGGAARTSAASGEGSDASDQDDAAVAGDGTDDPSGDGGHGAGSNREGSADNGPGADDEHAAGRGGQPVEPIAGDGNSGSGSSPDSGSSATVTGLMVLLLAAGLLFTILWRRRAVRHSAA
jgi:hypothetical protein